MPPHDVRCDSNRTPQIASNAKKFFRWRWKTPLACSEITHEKCHKSSCKNPAMRNIGLYFHTGDAKRRRSGLLSRFGARCERPECQIAGDMGRATRATKAEECQKPQPPPLLKKVSQYTSHLYCNTPPICTAVLLVPLRSEEREILSVLLPFVSQYASHLYCNTPPICIAVLLGKSWWLWSPECSPTKAKNHEW